MSGIVIPYTTTITTSSGSGSITTVLFQSLKYGGILSSFLMKAALTGTMFNFYLKNPDGERRYKKENITTEFIDNQILLPVRGIWTIEVVDCDPDDTITFEAGFQEAKA